jgi:hypothetical protein
MNEIERAKLAPMVSAKASGYERHPYIHTDLMRAPITFLWWALTPSGRQSKYFHTETFYRLSSSCKLGRDSDGHLVTIYVPSQHYRSSDLELRNLMIERGAASLERLPAGYVWHGPFLWSVLRPPQEEKDGFRLREPAVSEGIPLGYAMTNAKGALAVELATKVLADRAVPA